MSLHPQARAMTEAFSKGPALDYATLTAAEFRAAFDVPTPATSGPEHVKVEDRWIPREQGMMRVRLYYPRGQGPFPITLYLHGGGFVIGSPNTTDGICATLATEARTLVISPDYRLAPEAPFPAGVNDAWTALLWSQRSAREINGIGSKIAVAGDSSGGNFAAVLAQMSRAGGLSLCHQLLLYPVLDHCFETPSYVEFATGYFLTAEMMGWFWRQYLPDAELGADWRASPLRHPDLARVPPATIFTAQYDVLRDEAETYAKRLHQASVPVYAKRWEGQIHGFLLQQGIIEDAQRALVEAGALLRQAWEEGD